MGSSVNRRGTDLVQCRGEQSGDDASREPGERAVNHTIMQWTSPGWPHQLAHLVFISVEAFTCERFSRQVGQLFRTLC